jgi:serine/threonine-protein kinase RsbW
MMTEIVINESSPLFSKENMQYKEFSSDFTKIRYYTLVLVSSAPSRIKESNLLEQQVSELIKNGISHGNKNDPRKILKIWYSFTNKDARLIVEDEGEGFKEIKAWNDFNRKRVECIRSGNINDLINYISFRSQNSKEKDGGNALFAALEYWDGGIVFNKACNAVAVKKTFAVASDENLSEFKPWDINSDRPAR